MLLSNGKYKNMTETLLMEISWAWLWLRESEGTLIGVLYAALHSDRSPEPQPIQTQDHFPPKEHCPILLNLALTFLCI